MEYALEADTPNSETVCFGFTLGPPSSNSYSSPEKLMYRCAVLIAHHGSYAAASLAHCVAAAVTQVLQW